MAPRRAPASRNSKNEYSDDTSQKTEYMQMLGTDDIQQIIRASPGIKWTQISMHHAVQEHMAECSCKSSYDKSECGNPSVVYFEILESHIPDVGQPITNRPPRYHASRGNNRRPQIRMEKSMNRPLVCHNKIQWLQISNNVRQHEHSKAEPFGNNGLDKESWAKMKWRKRHFTLPRRKLGPHGLRGGIRTSGAT